MADAFSKDNQTTQSRDVICLAHYLGYTLVRVQVGLDRSETFTVACPALDFEQVVQESGSEDTQVMYKALMRSSEFVGSKVAYARKNGGVWTSFTKPQTPQRPPVKLRK